MFISMPIGWFVTVSCQVKLGVVSPIRFPVTDICTSFTFIIKKVPYFSGDMSLKSESLSSVSDMLRVMPVILLFQFEDLKQLHPANRTAEYILLTESFLFTVKSKLDNGNDLSVCEELYLLYFIYISKR